MGRQMFVLLAMITALVVGCDSGFKNQNPMDGQPDNIKRAIPPEKLTESPAADVLPEDSLQIDTDLFYEFVEGEEKEVVISSRALLPDTDYTLEIEGLERRMDAAKATASADNHQQTILWTPPQGWVGDQAVRRTRITVALNAKRGKTHLSRRKDVEIIVFRADMGPEIIQVGEMPPKGIREGDSFNFEVKVRDPESVSTTSPLTGKPPVLRLVETHESSSLTSMMSIDDDPKRDETDPQVWTFKVSISLSGEHNLTDDSDTHYFGLQAVNRHLVPSETSKQTVVIRTSLKEPVVTWNEKDSVIFYEGKENYFSFSIIDRRGEGKTSIEWVTDWKKFPGLMIACMDGDSSKDTDCHVAWTPKSTPELDLPKIIEFEFKVFSRTTVTGDDLVKEVTEKRRILMQKIGQPPIESELMELLGARLDEERIKADNAPDYSNYGPGGH